MPLTGTPTRHERWIAWAIGFGAVALFSLYFSVDPPYDGDAYEHAEVAKNLLERGELMQDHHLYPCLDHLPLPAPVARRLSLHVLLQMPFQFLFGSHVLVLLLPFLLTLLFVPRVALGALGPVFGARPTLLASAVVAFHPQLVMYFSVDPNVEPPLTLAVLAGFWAFRTRRFALCGLALGIGALIKPTSLVVFGAFGLAIIWRQRDLLRQRKLWVGAALAVLAGGPMILWSQYTLSQGIMVDAFVTQQITPELIRSDTVAHFFHIHRGPWEDPGTTFFDWLEIVSVASWDFLWGNQWFFGQHQGALEMLGWLLMPLMPFGLLAVENKLDQAAIGLAVVLFILANMVLTAIGAEPRLLMPVMVFTGAAAFAGLERLVADHLAPRLSVGLALFEIMPGIVAVLIMSGDLATRPHHTLAEFESIGEILPPGDGPILTSLQLSFAYHHDSLALPIPLGPMTDALELAERRGARGMALFRTREGACLPYDPALRPIAETERLCVYGFDWPAKELAAKLSPEVAAFEPMDYQLGGEAHYAKPIRSAPALAFAALGWSLGLVWLVGWLGMLVLAAHRKKRGAWGLIFTIAFIASIGTYIFYFFFDFEDRDHGQAVQDRYAVAHETMRVQAEVPEGLPLAYRPLDLVRDDGEFACVRVLPPEASCPPPFEERQCTGAPLTDAVTAGAGLLIGCPDWGEGGTRPLGVEAGRLTQEVRAQLDREARALQAKGWRVQRYNRMIVALP